MIFKSILFGKFQHQFLAKNLQHKWINYSKRLMSQYPIDDQIFGLNEEQRQVFFLFY
jgi:hypothetical protein